MEQRNESKRAAPGSPFGFWRKKRIKRLPLPATFLLTISSIGLWVSGAVGAPEFSFETTSRISAQNRPIIEEALQLAMDEVKANPPARQNPYTSRAKRRVHVVLADSTDPLALQVFDHSRESAASDGSDAFTFTAATAGEGTELITFVFILVDRIFWSPTDGKQHADAYIRLLTALGHEIYGNLPTHLKLKLGVRPEPATFEERQREEIAAFKAGIAFLKRYQVSDAARAHKASFLVSALERERASLETWVHPSCPRELLKKKR